MSLTMLGLVYRRSSGAFGGLPAAARSSGSAVTVTETAAPPGADLPSLSQAVAPGVSFTRCFTVTYQGGPSVELRMHGPDRTATRQPGRSLRLNITAGLTDAPGCPSPTHGQLVFDGPMDHFPTAGVDRGWSRRLAGRDTDTSVFAVTARLDRNVLASLQGGLAALGFAWTVQQTA